MGLVRITFKMPDLAKKLRNSRQELMLFVAAQMQYNRGQLFAHEGAYNGRPRWAELKLRQGQILAKTGRLKNSIGPVSGRHPDRPIMSSDGFIRFYGDTIKIGSKLAYARMMNDGTAKLPGGVLRPVKAKALMIPLPSGKAATPATKQLRGSSKKVGKQNVIFRKSVRIPPRPFDQWNHQDQMEIQVALRNKIAQVLNR